MQSRLQSLARASAPILAVLVSIGSPTMEGQVAALADAPGSVRLEFEVASVRPITGPTGILFTFSSAGPQARFEGYNLQQLVMEAFGLKNYQVAPNSDLNSSQDQNYTILAKAPGDSGRTRDEFRAMLRSLLEDRFQLKVHRDSKRMPVYALLAGASGTKLKETAQDAPKRWFGGVRGRNQTISATHLDMNGLATGLANFADRPIVNRTGIPGEYDIEFEATPSFRLRGEPQASDISVFTAVQEQLGLRLVALEENVEVLVVDQIKPPSGN